MTRQEKVDLLNELLEIEEKNDIGNLTSTNRREFQQWVEDLEQEPILNKISAEIDKARFIDKDTRICKNALASGLEVALQIIDKYKAEYEQRLEVGDEVIHKTITKCKPHVITQIRAEWVGVLSDNGYPLTWEKKKVVKTGKHYDIQSILDGLKED